MLKYVFLFIKILLGVVVDLPPEKIGKKIFKRATAVVEGKGNISESKRKKLL